MDSRNPFRKRNVQVIVRFTHDEARYLRQAAYSAGLTVAAYVRKVTLYGGGPLNVALDHDPQDPRNTTSYSTPYVTPAARHVDFGRSLPSKKDQASL